MKTIIAVSVVLMIATASWAGDYMLQSYCCDPENLKITVTGKGALEGPHAQAWLFKYGYLRHANHKARPYRYACPAVSDISACRLTPTPKFARWQSSRLIYLADK